MASYAEILVAAQDDGLRNRIRVACVIAAELVRTEATATTNHLNRLLWAKSVYSGLDQSAAKMLWAVLGQNKTFTLAQITGASDADVQTAVNNAVDVFATGA